MTRQEIQTLLREEAEPAYKAFSQRLTPGCGNMYGVRIPKLRALSKRMITEQWREWVDTHPTDSFEEKILWGLCIATARTTDDEHYSLTADFVPSIDSWAVCDVCCSSMHFMRHDRRRTFDFIEPYLHSANEFEVRFGAVVLLDHLICDECIDSTLVALAGVTHTGYYATMGVAWALSVCYVKYPDTTFRFLTNNKIAPDTITKTISKVNDSYRVSAENKSQIKLLAKQ